jgi:hypothetical protein
MPASFRPPPACWTPIAVKHHGPIDTMGDVDMKQAPAHVADRAQASHACRGRQRLLLKSVWYCAPLFFITSIFIRFTGSFDARAFPYREDRMDAAGISSASEINAVRRATGTCGRYSSSVGPSGVATALADASFVARSPSISAEQPKSGTPSRRKVRSSSTPRESANVNPGRLRHTRSEALAAAIICRASSTHAPSNFPSRLIETKVTDVG